MQKQTMHEIINICNNILFRNVPTCKGNGFRCLEKCECFVFKVISAFKYFFFIRVTCTSLCEEGVRVGHG